MFYFTYMRNLHALADEEGQDMIEYALIVAVIAIFSVIAIGFLGGALGGGFNTMAETINSVFGIAVDAPIPTPTPGD